MMNLNYLREACLALGMEEPISIEPDGTVWLGTDAEREYPDMAPIRKKAEALAAEASAARESVNEKLKALGFTKAEIMTLIGA